MDLVNQKIEHISFGSGTVILQEQGKLSIQFSNQIGIKQFIYPDAFEKYLKLSNFTLDKLIQEEIYFKKMIVEAQKLKTKQEYDDDAKNRAIEKSKLLSQKRRSLNKSKNVSNKKF